MTSFTPTDAQVAALKLLKVITITSWCVEILLFMAIGIYWWWSPQANPRIIASGFFVTVFAKSIVQTLCVRQMRLVMGETIRSRYWIGFAAKFALMAVAIYIICFRW